MEEIFFKELKKGKIQKKENQGRKVIRVKRTIGNLSKFFERKNVHDDESHMVWHKFGQKERGGLRIGKIQGTNCQILN